jgi:hypothetical protein
VSKAHLFAENYGTRSSDRRYTCYQNPLAVCCQPKRGKQDGADNDTQSRRLTQEHRSNQRIVNI